MEGEFVSGPLVFWAKWSSLYFPNDATNKISYSCTEVLVCLLVHLGGISIPTIYQKGVSSLYTSATFTFWFVGRASCVILRDLLCSLCHLLFCHISCFLCVCVWDLVESMMQYDHITFYFFFVNHKELN